MDVNTKRFSSLALLVQADSDMLLITHKGDDIVADCGASATDK